MEKWQGKYRIPSNRLPHYDYGENGAYFITICTHNRAHFFGECEEGKMKLSTVGAIVQGFWYEIPKHFPFVTLEEFVVMPNHVHGILIINQSTVETLQCNVFEPDASLDIKTLHCNVSTGAEAKNEFFSKISPKANSAATIIRSYKSICSKHIHSAFPLLNFQWQARFYDHVIRNEQSHLTISNYVLTNLLNWEQDKFYDNELAV